MVTEEKYLIQVDGQERESQALRHLCTLPFMLDELLVHLGVPAGFYWVMLGLPHGHLVESREGDVDLLAGPLTWTNPEAPATLIERNRKEHPNSPEHLHRYCAALELADSGGLAWPPPLNHLVAIEAKCAYFDSGRQKVMSQKSSDAKTRNMRLQIEELLTCVPFNRVALLDFIVNPPVSGGDGQAWLNAADVAATSFEQMLPTLRRRLADDSPSGHFAMSWGAVVGGAESHRGSGGPALLRMASENPLMHEISVRKRRMRMEENLHRILAEHSQPRTFPAVL